MGVELDAIVFWGWAFSSTQIPWGLEEPETYIQDWHQRLERLSTEQPALAAEAAGCEVGYHNHSDKLMAYLTVTESVTLGDLFQPGEVKSLTVQPDWEPRLRAFCTLMGIPWKEPDWYLVTYAY